MIRGETGVGERSGGTGRDHRGAEREGADGTSMNSAMPPSRPRPPPPIGTGASAGFCSMSRYRAGPGGCPASPRPVHRDGLTHLQTPHVGAECVDPARHLATNVNGGRQGTAEPSKSRIRCRSETGPGCPHPDNHLLSTGTGSATSIRRDRISTPRDAAPSSAQPRSAAVGIPRFAHPTTMASGPQGVTLPAPRIAPEGQG